MYIMPCNPWANGCGESFFSKLRDKQLNVTLDRGPEANREARNRCR
jgi:hypothetical protein